MKNDAALKDLLYRLADDELIIGHRNSEWTGLGPILEEDLAFSSMAQDELGHAQAYYMLLEKMGEGHPDQLAFNRKEKDFRSCHFVEAPIGDYSFSLVRHFLYDFAEFVRLTNLTTSSFEPLAELSKKLLREEKFHTLHAKTWMIQLGNGSEEGRIRLQSALNDAFPMAFGLFEPTEFTAYLDKENIMTDESKLKMQWLDMIKPIIEESSLKIPVVKNETEFFGGRKGFHSVYLKQLLDEMTEVFSIDPSANW